MRRLYRLAAAASCALLVSAFASAAPAPFGWMGRYRAAAEKTKTRVKRAGSGPAFRDATASARDAAAPTAGDAAALEESTDAAKTPAYNQLSFGKSLKNDVSPRLRDIPAAPFVLQPRHFQHEPLAEFEEEENAPDPVVQGSHAPNAMPGTVLNFDGMVFPGVACNCAPPDTDGEIGATQYVQMVNEGIQVFDKTTGASVLGPIGISTLWSGFTGVCEFNGDGDPVVLYDQLANRWVISQFAGTSVPTDECVAVSTTSDATGSYNRYDFHLGSNYFDYPKLAMWPDAYYLAENVFNSSGTAYLGPQPFALDRAAMLAGTPATFVTPGLQSSALGFMLPADLDGSITPPAGAPNPWLSTAGSSWAFYRFHVDFGTPVNSTFTLATTLSPAGFTTLCGGTRNCVPQTGVTASDGLDGIGDRPMFRIAYRRFGDGHEALIGNRTVSSSGIGGIRWFEIDNATSGTPGFVQQGTYQPDTTWRWLGSIAMDVVGDIALGFSASSASIHPEIRYAGRLAGDPAGTLGQGEATLFSGTGSQTSTGNRWGDYSDLTVDPVDDCTFWYTNEYYSSTGSFNWRTRIGNFKFPGCSSGPSGTLQGTVTICSSGVPIPGATVDVGGGVQTTTDATGHYSITLLAGDYTVTISKAGFTPGGGPATITDGGTTTLDACLTGTPAPAAAGATVTAENCPPGNGAPDPGETVTVSFCIRNAGGADTVDLVGTLQESGGVTNPSAAQHFGALSAGGQAVCQDFTFTVDPAVSCGGTIAATIALQDGSTDFGTVEFDMTAGTAVVPLAESFDAVTVPALPAGWAVSGTGGFPNWATEAPAAPDTAPNDAFVNDPGSVSDRNLDSPTLAIATAAAYLTFQNFYDLEPTYDGGVLEISIAGAPFLDILAAGGSFVTNGYNGTISTLYGSPIAGRQAWTGNAGSYLTTEVVLPAAAAGQNVVLRWRAASDNSVAATGWRVDTIRVSDGFACCVGPSPVTLAVDAHATAAPPSGLGVNGVLEPGETVSVEPGYFNFSASAMAVTGTASNFTGPVGATYILTKNTADYGSIGSLAAADCYTATGDCYGMTIDNPVARPAPHWDATFDEALSSGASKTWTLHVGDSFTDEPASDSFYRYVETIFHNGVTGGCGGSSYCPANPTLRKQMAVFLLKAHLGASYVPPAAAGIFGDVPASDPFAPWIEDLYNREITAGCSVSPLNYCPDDAVLRQQMAVFLLKTLLGSSYTPPACAGAFADVPCPSQFADWIEDLATRAITGGCGGGNYCPLNPNTRGQMAVFLTKTFSLLLYGP